MKYPECSVNAINRYCVLGNDGRAIGPVFIVVGKTVDCTIFKRVDWSVHWTAYVKTYMDGSFPTKQGLCVHPFSVFVVSADSKIVMLIPIALGFLEIQYPIRPGQLNNGVKLILASTR